MTMKVSIPSFANVVVLVVGDVMLDRYWHGATSRISPEAPVPVIHITKNEERLGGAGNVAVNIAALGAQVKLLAITGKDDAANTIQRLAAAAGVECLLQSIPDIPTIIKLRVLSRHQQLIRLDFENVTADVDPKPIIATFEEHLKQVQLVVLSDYGKGTLRSIETLIASAKAAGKPVLVDPKGQDFTKYHGATLITPNAAEFEAVVGPCSDRNHMVTKGMALLHSLALEALLITRGEHGMMLLSKNHTAIHIPVQAREVYDVTGAGDTVISVLAAAIASGQGLHDAATLANLAAGVVVAKLGTATVTKPELYRACHTYHDPERRVLSANELKFMLEDVRSHNKKVVMTNGCFDILHAGHITYLQQAKRLGDHLIVAVNDDASVRQLKGETRPINKLQHRMLALAALSCVDWVVPFSEETPEKLIESVLPDILVKGGDYRAQDIAGYDGVTKNGGEVVILPLIEGLSTTSIIESCSKNL